jgi:hypothetical protein
VTDSSIKPIRTYPSLPEPGNDLASHSNILRQVKEGIQVHERRTSNWRDSFVRLGELVDLEILKVEGDLITLGDAVGSGLEPGPDGYILATIAGEIVWVPFEGLPVPSFDYTMFSPDEIIEDAETVITITGTGFTEFSTATFDGVEVPVNFIDENEIQITVTAPDQGTFVIEVTNPAPGGGSDSDSIDVVGNPVPVLITLAPDSIVEGEATFTVTITGTGFIPTSQARWDGADRDTTYNSPTEIEVEILDSDIATEGTFDIDVINPAPGGGASNALEFEVETSASLWTPDEIVTQLWFDAADAATKTITSGRVSQWDDKSSFARHVSQSNATNRPVDNTVTLNSLPVMSFDSSDHLNRTKAAGLAGLVQNTGQVSVFAVRRFNNLANGTCVVLTVGTGDASSGRISQYSVTSVDDHERYGGIRVDGGGFVNETAGLLSVSTWQVTAGLYNAKAALLTAHRNGSVAIAGFTWGTAGLFSNTEPDGPGDIGLAVGAWTDPSSGTFEGDIAELIVTHYADTATRQRIEGYLAWKWGLQGSLPGGHPYESAAPVVVAGADPSFDSVKLLMHCEGTNGTEGYIDSGHRAYTLDSQGTATLHETAQFKFGASSIRMPDSFGSNDGIRVLNSNVGMGLTNQDFTIEFFVRFNSLANAQQCFMSQYSITDGSRAWWFRRNTGDVLNFAYSNTGFDAASVGVSEAWTPSTGVWYHVAVCRDGANLRMFVDGTQLGSTHNISTTTIHDSDETWRIGAFFAGGNAGIGTAQNVQGWMDEIRVTIGAARYTSNFTPPAAAFPDF